MVILFDIWDLNEDNDLLCYEDFLMKTGLSLVTKDYQVCFLEVLFREENFLLDIEYLK